MKIAIVGAGIIGVTTAYELARDGHDVTVFDQRSAAAEEASFATAGLLAPVLLSPWALPGFGLPLRLFGAQATLRMAGGWSRGHLSWLHRWRAAAAAQAAPGGVLEYLAQFSYARTRELAQLHALDFEKSEGRLILLRTDQELAKLEPTLRALRDAGSVAQLVDAETARAIEPGLSPEAPLSSAIHLPNAAAGNCRLFAQLLRQGTQASGVHYEFGTTIERLSTSPTGVHVRGELGMRPFDAVVLCAGMASAQLLPEMGLRLPMVAVYGYSVSAPLREALHAPRASVVDLGQQIAITRLGQRVRISGGAEWAGHHAPHHRPTVQHLYRTLNDWFPGSAQLSSGVQVWRGARTMMPDGAPVVGPSGIPGLWLNTGHGANGWALASGCARALADLMGHRSPPASLDGLGLRNF